MKQRHAVNCYGTTIVLNRVTGDSSHSSTDILFYIICTLHQFVFYLEIFFFHLENILKYEFEER